MTSLKELSITLGLLASDHNPAAVADGWENYVWRVRPANQCISREKGFCYTVRSNWDWKRPQHYAFAFSVDPIANTITSRITLNNEDTADTDQVCIVGTFIGAAGKEVGVVFVNWRSEAGKKFTRDVTVRPSAPVSTISTVVVGSKQCDDKPASDVRNFARIRSLIGQR